METQFLRSDYLEDLVSTDIPIGLNMNLKLTQYGMKPNLMMNVPKWSILKASGQRHTRPNFQF